MPTKNMGIFRAYDIRGIYGKDIKEKTAELIGKAFGTFIGKGKRIAVSRDERVSGESLKKHLTMGLLSVGCDVIDIGTTTTPMMYFAVASHKLDGGISVTASHNPAEWNGFKMTKERGVLCSEGLGMEEIKEIFLRENFEKVGGIGTSSNVDITDNYSKFILSKIQTQRKLKIVLDPGNGAACGIAEKLFRNAGHEIFVINGHPDGTFPSRPSDPTEENVWKLKQEVVRQKADIGIAFDGDADRLAFVDDLGRYVWSGNVTIPIFSQYYLNRNKGGKVVYDVCCSSFVDEFIKLHGGKPIVSKVGHSFVMNKMIEEGAIFGGEHSSHLYFSEIFGFDDAIFAGLKMAEIVVASNEKFSRLIDKIPRYPASSVREIPCDDNMKFDVVKKVADRLRGEGYKTIDIDGVKAFDKDGSWVLIRGSNTLPVIKVNSEARTQEKMRQLFDYAGRIVAEEIGKQI